MKQFILWQHTRLLKRGARGFSSYEDQCHCTTKSNFSPFFKLSVAPCIEEKSFSKYNFDSSGNLWFYLTAMTFVTVATKVYHQDFAKKNARICHSNCRFSFKQMCKIRQIIFMIENCYTFRVENNVSLTMFYNWITSNHTVNCPVLQ